MHVSVAGAEVDVASGKTYGEVLAEALSKKKIKKAVAAKCNGALKDLSAPVDGDCGEIVPVFTDDPEGLDILRHSTAHIMAEAVKRLFPEAKVTIGPSIEHGFYYDFDYKRPFTPEDLDAIEAEMQKIVGRDEPFTCRVLPKDEARGIFSEQDETYKLEIMDEIEADTVSIYRQGEFTDLCRGPHIPSTGKIAAFKLTGVSGAYWRGDEKNKMLQRIYGAAFASPKDLKKHLDRLEEAKRRDHRKLGQQLDLFSFSDDAPGMPIWHPKGMLLRTILEDFERKEHLKRGYDIVQGPQLLKRDLWERSGHYDNYRENMYFSEIDEQSYGIKPMNCLAHMHIYKSRVRSYRDMPQRYFELGVVHRHEKSGVLHGLTRVRQFTQDDAHIICRPDQLQDEIIGVVKFTGEMMELFGFEYEVELSTRPEKSIGSDEEWERATNALVHSLETLGLEYELNEGDGAFYGPKIDVKLKDSLDRRWQCATIQCDFTLPERFDLVYVGQDGERHRPVMVHRTILGSMERFIGVLVEHYAGAFPVWLAPVQARILTVTDAQNEFAESVRTELERSGIRIEADLRNEKLGYKVREAQLEKIPYLLVIGDQEVEAGGVNVRLRGKNLGIKSPQEVRDMILDECQEPFKRGGMSYSFSCSGTM